MSVVAFEELPENVRMLGNEFVVGVREMLGENLHGVYMYGATVFPDRGRPSDIDCHVVLEAPLTREQRGAIEALHARLAQDFPPLGAELDVVYVLRKEAEGANPPKNQMRPGTRDESWALHCAHVRAGYFLRLFGPPPERIFPAPSWERVAEALDHELAYVEEHLHWPAYCVLNLCRIVYSRMERNPAVSKRFSGAWARVRYPAWSGVIAAALRCYEGTATQSDVELLRNKVSEFLNFMRTELVGLHRSGISSQCS